jgi:mRNA interferase RelE/StbE
MAYQITFNKRADDDLGDMSPEIRRRIVGKIRLLGEGLQGDVKRLKNFSPNYRLRVGNWRVLFEVEGRVIVIHRIVHRSEAYEG